jgi:hypothetical protein
MDWIAFGLLLNDNILLYVAILLVSVVLYYFIFRRMYLSILDPIMFSLIFSVFGFSVVWFLYFTNSLANKYLISYLLTQFAFIFGLFSFKNLRKSKIMDERKTFRLQNEDLFLRLLFITSSIIYMIAQLISYKVVGIPLLLGNHIDIYNSSGGWGLLGRFIDVIKPISAIALIYFLFKKTASLSFFIYKYFFLVTLLIFFALSGSRGEFMTLGFIFFCYIMLNGNELKRYFLNIRKLEVGLLLAGLFFVFLTIVVQSQSAAEGPGSLEVFLFRLVASGDTYYFAYPNGNIEHLNGTKPFLALFGDIFSTLRIVPRENQPQVLGYQLFNLFYDADVTAGPNPRHNVFGYVYFGFYGSIIYSYLLGLLLSFVRNKLFFTFRKNALLQIAFILLYLNLAIVETDAPSAFSNLENIILILPFPVIITSLLFIGLTKPPKEIVPDNIIPT